eukprot:gene33773-41663_t
MSMVDAARLCGHGECIGAEPDDFAVPEDIRIPVQAIRGRGAASALPHRFARDVREAVDDGWGNVASPQMQGLQANKGGEQGGMTSTSAWGDEGEGASKSWH